MTANLIADEASAVATAKNEKNNSPLKVQVHGIKIEPRPAQSKERFPRPAKSSPYGSDTGFSNTGCLNQLKEELSCTVI